MNEHQWYEGWERNRFSKMEGRLQLYPQFIAARMNHHTVTVSKLKCRSNKEGIGGNRRQFQTGQIVVSL